MCSSRRKLRSSSASGQRMDCSQRRNAVSRHTIFNVYRTHDKPPLLITSRGSEKMLLGRFDSNSYLTREESTPFTHRTKWFQKQKVRAHVDIEAITALGEMICSGGAHGRGVSVDSVVLVLRTCRKRQPCVSRVSASCGDLPRQARGKRRVVKGMCGFPHHHCCHRAPTG